MFEKSRSMVSVRSSVGDEHAVIVECKAEETVEEMRSGEFLPRSNTVCPVNLFGIKLDGATSQKKPTLASVSS
jgi:hypothetical protein